MSEKFYTKVKASEGFWEKFMAKQLEGETSFYLSNKISNELIITSTGKPALDEIIKISIDYPEEVFLVKTESDDAFNNYVHLYECSKGKSKLIKEGYEYCFKFNISDSDRIDSFLLEKFKHEAVNFFKKNQYLLTKEVHMNLSDFDFEERDCWSVSITYETKEIKLTATKKGLTCINIDVELSEYDELPF